MLTTPEPLSAHHALDAFDCGVASLNDWLQRRAMIDDTPILRGSKNLFADLGYADVTERHTRTRQALAVNE